MEDYFGKINRRFDERARVLVERGFTQRSEHGRAYFGKYILQHIGAELVSNEFIMHAEEQSWKYKLDDIDRLEEIANSDLNWVDEPIFDDSDDSKSLCELRTSFL